MTEDSSSSSRDERNNGQDDEDDITRGEGGDEEDRVHKFTPPFLVRTKSRPERESMHNQRRRQQEENRKSPYDPLRRIMERFSTSALLENKAAVARDHLGIQTIYPRFKWLYVAYLVYKPMNERF